MCVYMFACIYHPELSNHVTSVCDVTEFIHMQAADKSPRYMLLTLTHTHTAVIWLLQPAVD